ncbi:hypothetical protein ACFLYU_05280 [Candidatus Dependentiae bacterium]
MNERYEKLKRIISAKLILFTLLTLLPLFGYNTTVLPTYDDSDIEIPEYVIDAPFDNSDDNSDESQDTSDTPEDTQDNSYDTSYSYNSNNSSNSNSGNNFSDNEDFDFDDLDDYEKSFIQRFKQNPKKYLKKLAKVCVIVSAVGVTSYAVYKVIKAVTSKIKTTARYATKAAVFLATYLLLFKAAGKR